MNAPQTRGSAEIIAELLDPETFSSWDAPLGAGYFSAEYGEQLRRAELTSGADEAVITGEGLIGGHRVVVAVSEFGFIGGSLSEVAAQRLVSAIDRASTEGLPFIGAIASGGTRMQEGTAAFVRMRDIAAAFVRHRAARLPSVVFLCHPVFGGALATWGSLATVTIAERRAAIGLLGARIQRAVTGSALPSAVQRAEYLARNGLVDGVVPFAEFRTCALRLLDLLMNPDLPAEGSSRPATPGSAPGAAPRRAARIARDFLERSRRPSRAGVRELLAKLPQPVVPLRGTDPSATGAGVLCLARIGGIRAVVIGQDRRAPEAHFRVADLRLAQEGVRIAEALGLPIVTVVDTPGAELSARAEEQGVAREVANTLAAMESRTVPAVGVLLGEGCGAAALALLGTDTVIAAENAWLSAMPLEGAADILFDDASLVVEAATAQRIAAAELQESGIVQRLVPETVDDGDGLADAVMAACADELGALLVERDSAEAVEGGARDTGLEDSIPAETFKAAFRLHPGGVALVTADSGTGPAAMTISSLSSVSIEPPLLIFSASALSSSFPVFAEAETVVVHMLSSDDLELAQLGATSGIDRFAESSCWTRLPSGEPVFPAAFAWLRGRIVQRLEAGNSMIFVVHVVGASVLDDEHAPSESSGPLVYHARTWHRLGPHTALRPWRTEHCGPQRTASPTNLKETSL